MTPSEYQQYLAEQRNHKSAYAYNKSTLKKRRFTKYQYRLFLANRAGFKTTREHEDYLAQQRNYESSDALRKEQAEKRSKRPLNKKVKELIIQRLADSDKSAKDLADYLGIAPHTVRQYLKGYYLPDKKVQPKLLKFLGVKCKTIEELV